MNFWNNIIGIEKEMTENENINKILDEISNKIKEIKWKELTKEKFQEAIKRTPPWKAPGLNMVSGIMLKNLKMTEKLFPIIKEIISRKR